MMKPQVPFGTKSRRMSAVAQCKHCAHVTPLPLALPLLLHKQPGYSTALARLYLRWCAKTDSSSPIQTLIDSIRMLGLAMRPCLAISQMPTGTLQMHVLQCLSTALWGQADEADP